MKWSKDRAYRSCRTNDPVQFYMYGLCNSLSFDFILGYFSSSAINILSLGFATFLYSGGKMRMIINDVLSGQDKEALLLARDGVINNDLIDLSNITSLKRSLDNYGTHFFQCIAWLIANERIQIVIIKPKGKDGISHYKSGLFSDGIDKVSFKASCNFTAYGLLENLEELDARLSWEDELSSINVSNQASDFDLIFSGQAEFAEYLQIEDVTVALKQEFGNVSQNELIIQEKELIEKKIQILNNKELRKTFEKAITRIEEINKEPRFPYSDGAREYQIEAYKRWVKNGYKGIFAMATGTGKTITSLNCLLSLYKETGTYKAIITVPTIALLDQWKKECIKFNFSNIITVSSKENWNNDLAFFNTATKLTNISFIVIVTYASLSRLKFQSHFKQLTSETLLIADEVHNMGSPRISRMLPNIHLVKRIGLSATPSRKYDDEGNTSIQSFFNDKFPYIFSYTMKQALDVGWLCKYKYLPHIVYLTEEELVEYIKISKQLLKYLDSKTGRYKESKEVEDLLLKRKRIIHKAVNKKTVFKKIMRAEFVHRGNLKYTLVYVPEGLEADYSKVDQYEENDEETNLINEYTKITKDTDESIMVKQYTASTKNRNEVINDFENGRDHVLTSMKCLDEVVDVPLSELAIFFASTGNPRQFIQRRGRVLRNHIDKIHAVIHDLVVVPQINPESNTYDMERNLIKNELERVTDFSELSLNKMDTYNELKDILEYYNLNLND